MVNTAYPGRLRWLCPGEPNVIDESNFGFVLRELRQCAGLSQRELAERIGSTQSAIARMEKGEAEPKLCTLEKLAEALNRDLHVHVKAAEPA
jgi:ribosome-binding protein aMBF1 (putative translation factor)